jgi:hypothetical protein
MNIVPPVIYGVNFYILPGTSLDVQSYIILVLHTISAPARETEEMSPLLKGNWKDLGPSLTQADRTCITVSSIKQLLTITSILS